MHCSKIFPSVGDKSVELLARFIERAPAKTLLTTLPEALKTIGLQLTDISGISTDGAKVMRKLGRMMAKEVAPRPFYHQTCLAHALHLAVSDTLPKKKTKGRTAMVKILNLRTRSEKNSASTVFFRTRTPNSVANVSFS